MPAVAGQHLREHGNFAFKACSCSVVLDQRGLGARLQSRRLRASADASSRRQEGRYADALRLYDAALKELPDDAGLLCNCASTRLRLGDHQQVTRAVALHSALDGRAALCAPHAGCATTRAERCGRARRDRRCRTRRARSSCSEAKKERFVAPGWTRWRRPTSYRRANSVALPRLHVAGSLTCCACSPAWASLLSCAGESSARAGHACACMRPPHHGRKDRAGRHER